MTSIAKTGYALIDSDEDSCLLPEARIIPGDLYVITKAIRRASFAAHNLSTTVA
jgi:hypothetical protein